jgi:RNA polymerase sigma-70 factor (ECF subfamily)
MTSAPPTAVAPVTDAGLAARAADGDRDALGELYRRHAPRLTALARRLLRNSPDAEDVVQDLFVALPAALGGYRDEGRLGAWLSRVTANLALKRLRSGHRRREDELPAEGSAATLSHAAPEHLTVRRAVDALPDTLRIVVLLKFVEGFSHAEIAELLGIGRGASEVRLFRAIRQLRNSLGA